MLLAVGKFSGWEIHLVGELIALGGYGRSWWCFCPNGQPGKRGYPCQHLHDMWDEACDKGLYSDKFNWTREGLAMGQVCRCRGKLTPLQHPPPRVYPKPPEAGAPARSAPCPCGAITGTDGVGRSKFSKCGGSADAPHEVGVWIPGVGLKWLTPPGVTPPVPPGPSPGPPPVPPGPPIPPTPGLPEKEQRRQLRVHREILKQQVEAEHNVYIDAVLERWRAWDALRRARKQPVRDEAEIQGLLQEVDEWAERARELRPAPKPKKGKK